MRLSSFPGLLQLRPLVLSAAGRPLRFAGTGAAAGGIQLLLLAYLTGQGWNALAANMLAFLLAAQVNFVLSFSFTWRDRSGFDRATADVPAAARPTTLSAVSRIARCWLLFHCSIALMALVNLLIFSGARTFMPTLAASAAGIAAGALGNYVAGDRIVFPAAAESRLSIRPRRHAA